MGQKLHRCRALNCRRMIPVHEFYCTVHMQLQRRNKEADRCYDRRRRHDKEAYTRNQFYHSRAWKKLRLKILERDNHLCQYCQLFGGLTIGSIVDHIVPREVAQALEIDETNLISCCQSCHNTKTKWEQAYYGTGKNNKLNAMPFIRNITDLVFVFEKREGGL